MNRPGVPWQRPKRLLRRLRFRAWHAARHHYMVAFTGALLLVAGAASLGAFSQPEQDLQLERRVIAVKPQPPITAPIVSVNAPRAPRLVMTYYIVNSQEMMDSFNTMKTELRHREWLEKSAYEVLLVRTPEDEASAFRAIQEARERCVCAEFHVEDLRR
jgi:hypothetical protein